MKKFYTRGGDDGFTARLGEGRLPKHHMIIDVVGAIDEASAALGMARAVSRAPRSQDLLLAIQRDLYHMMAEISATEEVAPRFREINETKVAWLEEQIESFDGIISMPKEFVVPGDTQGGATMALARTTVRKAERRVAQLYHDREVMNLELIRYLNRLSSLCFVLELYEDQFAGADQPTLAKD